MSVLAKVVKNSSAILPAGMSSVFNILIASSVAIEGYTNYISLISWATFLGALSAFSFVDLSISNKFKNTSHEDNLFLALITSLLVISGFFIFISYSSMLPKYVSDNSVILVFLALALCWTRCLHLFCANTKEINTLIISRCSRGLALLFCVPIYVFFSVNDFVVALYFQVVALIVGLFAAYEILLKLKLKAISTLSFPIFKISILRTFSVGIDMIHIPILFSVLNQAVASAQNYDESKVFLLGMGIPLISILTQIINEYARSRLNDIIKLFQDNVKAIILLILTLLISATILFVTKFYSENLLYFIFVIFSAGKLSSAFVGLLIYRLGFEKYFLLINTLATTTLLAVIYGAFFEASLLVNIILGVLVGKYLVAIALVSRSINRIDIAN